MWLRQVGMRFWIAPFYAGPERKVASASMELAPLSHCPLYLRRGLWGTKPQRRSMFLERLTRVDYRADVRQWPQPILMKVARPFAMVGVSGAGVGGASMRMKLAKASMSEITAGLEVAEVAGVVKLRELFGIAVKMQDGVSSR